MRKKSTFLLIVVLCLLLSACGNLKINKAAADYTGINYKKVMSELEEIGFKDIKLEEIQDLSSSSDMHDGDVGAISIDGRTDFNENTEFKSDSPVLITYHTIKKLEFPVSTDEIQAYDCDAIAILFQEGGFENISIDEVYDLDPDVYEVEFKNEVTIDGASYKKGDMIPFDANIRIICHRPYEEYLVKIIINFVPNFIFSKYNVVLSLNGEEYTIEHGNDAEYEFSLKEGTYALSFANEESSSVNGEIDLNVHCDMEAAFKIFCYSDEISVDTIYIDNKEELANDEVKVMSTKSAFTYENYKSVVGVLKEWGFQNIIEQPLYDIYWGLTEEGSVESVTIDGSNEYRRGDIFKKSAEVIVSYHLKEDDNPNKPIESKKTDLPEKEEPESSEIEETEPFETVETLDENLTIENCTELADILSNKAEYDESYVAFATKYKGRNIEFDGRVDSIMYHGKYKTRYDILVCAGDYDPDHQIGPTFKFEDSSAYDLGLGSLDDITKEIPVGSNVRVIAEVDSFNCDNYIFYLKPVSVKLR